MTSEIKFLVDNELGERVRTWARDRLPPDPHGSGPDGDQYRITSVYLDTDDFDVFHRRGSYGRSKYRIRRYEHDGAVFVERKLRTGSLLAKRRTPVVVNALPSLGNGGPPAGDPAQWFHRRLTLRRLAPSCQVSYLRTARVAATPSGPVRLTIDEAIRALPTSTYGFVDGEGRPLLTDRMILELKYSGYMPALFRELVEEFVLAPGAASKYRFAIEVLGAAPMHA